MPDIKIISVVVTFNRLELLKLTISGLRSQTRKPDMFIVINNSSTDGTYEWLNQQTDIKVVTQENIGSSGGQYTGMKTAIVENPDWVWIMDDDVVPEPDCLENLIKCSSNYKIVAPLRFNLEGKVFFNDTIKFNLKNPFRSIWKRILSQNDLDNDIIEADGVTFEGPMIHRDVIQKIGYAEKNFFIYADDSEYFIRAKKHGFISILAKNAKLIRQIDPPADEYKFTWKHFFIIRNLIVIDKLHASIPVKILRPWGYLITWLLRSKSKEDFQTVLKAFISAFFIRLRLIETEIIIKLIFIQIGLLDF